MLLFLPTRNKMVFFSWLLFLSQPLSHISASFSSKTLKDCLFSLLLITTITSNFPKSYRQFLVFVLLNQSAELDTVDHFLLFGRPSLLGFQYIILLVFFPHHWSFIYLLCKILFFPLQPLNIRIPQGPVLGTLLYLLFLSWWLMCWQLLNMYF